MKFDDFPTGLLVKCIKKAVPQAAKQYFTKQSSVFSQRAFLLRTLHEQGFSPQDSLFAGIIDREWELSFYHLSTVYPHLTIKDNHVMLRTSVRQKIKRKTHTLDQSWMVNASNVSYECKGNLVASREKERFFHAYSAAKWQHHPHFISFAQALVEFSQNPSISLRYLHSEILWNNDWRVHFCLSTYPDVEIVTDVCLRDVYTVLATYSPALEGIDLSPAFSTERLLHFVTEESPLRLPFLFT